MSRPNLISQIHELKYELRRPRLDPAELPRLVQGYDAKVEQACVQFKCSKAELLRAIAPDFGKWIKDEKLPPLEDAQ